MQAKPDVLVMGSLPPWDIEALSQDFTLHLLYEAVDQQGFLAKVGPGIRAIATKGEIGASAGLIDSLPALEMIACYGVGYDAIDVHHARTKSIPVTNVPDVLTEEVADMALGLLLATARRIPFGDNHVRSGDWALGPMPLTSRVWGKRCGIVGLGRIGRAIARRCEGFLMPIAYSGRAAKADVRYDFYPDPVSLAARSDILIIAAQGGPETRGLVSQAAIEALPKGAMLVNVARGSVVDEEALIEALASGHIGAAGLDVFMNEPRIDPVFSTFPQVVLQPHAASGTVETRKAMGKLMGDNLRAHFSGQPLLTPV